MTLLTAADLDGAGHQTLTWIARAVVCQHLRLLEFASGGFVAMSQLPGRAPEAGIQGIIHTLVFASASNAEKLVAKLQLQHRLKRALPDAEHGPVRAAAPTTAGVHEPSPKTEGRQLMEKAPAERPCLKRGGCQRETWEVTGQCGKTHSRELQEAELKLQSLKAKQDHSGEAYG
ncbi:unnamed protein product [Effrenium voratum]|uniref:Uncharacterized protein n=1 Tax=Effrenium voratum TaxID=2562239 RepID=A0AA36I3F9_9DINO|nr:unnamed protein product [Effrenium voratum]